MDGQPVTDNLVIWNAARVALEKANSIDEVKSIRDKAEAARAYAQQIGESLEMQNAIAEIKLRAERRAGELFAEIEREPGKRTSGNGCTRLQSVLEDTGIARRTAHNWQRIASLTPEIFEAQIATTKAAGEELTTGAMLKLAAKNLGVHFSSATPEHGTPQNIINATLECLGDIDLDPCSNSKEIPNIPAATHYTIEDDGLSHPWSGRVYMNPPYGRDISVWVDKLAQEYEQNHIMAAIALVPARTDTQWWQRLRDYPVCFITGRLSFGGNDDPAPFPSAVFYLGDDLGLFYVSFADLGDIWQRVQSDDVGQDY